MYIISHSLISVTNVRAGGLFEEGIIQKIVSHLIILVNNAVLQMQWIYIQCILYNKNNCSIRIDPNV
jgi:hypothetical protein